MKNYSFKIDGIEQSAKDSTTLADNLHILNIELDVLSSLLNSFISEAARFGRILKEAEKQARMLAVIEARKVLDAVMSEEQKSELLTT
ncbi:hypothetical protein LJC00_04350 [Dysgonomonas sp. OttesenSCG-928-M03]|nr:hypothetical protein [Dysgonomonas sp. OttesenSCG-928-M03]